LTARNRSAARRSVATIAISLAVLVVLAAPSSSAARRPAGVSPAFFGMNTGSALFDPGVDVGGQLARIRQTGTGIVRFPIYWSTAQPYRSWADVPPEERGLFTSVGGTPTSFGSIDQQILEFAKHGLAMLPTVLQAPPWARLQAALVWSPPARAQDYGDFVGALVKRYGTHGEFWKKHASLALYAPRWWQIWNEEDGGPSPEGQTLFWDGPKPYEPRYIAMLRSARAAARKADPNARIVLGGLFGKSWDALRRLYNFGARGLFDAVAVHPYANTPAHVLTILSDVHQVLESEHASRVPLLVTETGWPSSQSGSSPPGSSIYTTEAGQASELKAEYPLLVAHRRHLNLQAIFWYCWIGREPSYDPLDYSGLLRLTPSGTVQAKPALSAYTSALRHLEHHDPGAAFQPEPGL